MKVGVLKDIKVGEYRVIATPAEVSMLVGDGNEVYVQKGAGEGSGCAAGWMQVNTIWFSRSSLYSHGSNSFTFATKSQVA